MNWLKNYTQPIETLVSHVCASLLLIGKHIRRDRMGLERNPDSSDHHNSKLCWDFHDVAGIGFERPTDYPQRVKTERLF